MFRAILTASVVLPHIANAQLLNPGFEPDTAVGVNNVLPGGSTAVPGWTTTEQGVEWFDAAAFNAASPDGGYAIDLANFTFNSGGIQQTFPTVEGADYTIEFYFGTQRASGRTGTAEIFVDVGGNSTAYQIESTSAQMLWELRTYEFTALSDSTTLTFSNYQDANLHFANIDGIKLVPAPATSAIALTLGAACSQRRRR